MTNENDKVRAFAREVIDMINDRILYAKDDGREIKDLCWLENKLLATVESLLPKEEEVENTIDWEKIKKDFYNYRNSLDGVDTASTLFYFLEYNELSPFSMPKVEEVDRLKYAVENYPEGTEFISAFSGGRYISTGEFMIDPNGNVRDNGVDFAPPMVYYRNKLKWAEIVAKPEIVEPEFKLHPTTPDMQADFKKANPEMRFSEESNKLKESEFQKTAYSDEVKVIKKMIDYIKHDSEIMIPSERLMRINGEHITKKEYGLIMLEILCEELEQKFLPQTILEQKVRKKAEETIDSFMKSWNGHAPLREYREELIAELDKAFKFDPKKLS